MKLCLVGGGGFRTPLIYQALLRDVGSPRVTEVVLHDVDEQRLAAMTTILAQLAAGVPEAPQVSSHTSLRPAVEGSDFVFAAVRVGGLEGRCHDEHVALDLGVIGQETVGAGGLAYALRTVPVMLELARTVRELASSAYLVNFTNPAGIVTEAMQSVLGDRVLGVCDTPAEQGRRVAELLGVDPGRCRLDYAGLNHLGWLRRVLVDGVDVLPQVLADDALLARLPEAQLFGAEWIRALGVLPNEYLYYVYRRREALHSLRTAAATRGDQLAVSQREFFAQVPGAGAGAAQLWRDTVAARSASYMAEARGVDNMAEARGHIGSAEARGVDNEAAGAPEQSTEPDEGYAGVALRVLAAIARDEPATLVLNVRNRGTIAGLPADAVVEVPARVDAAGVRPEPVTQPALEHLGLMQQVKAVERHVISAAVTGSREAALRAFALHPLVDSVTVAHDLLDGYLARQPELTRVLDAR